MAFLRNPCRVKFYWLRLGYFVFLQFLLIFIVIILSRKSFATTGVPQRPSCSPTVFSSVESNAVSSPGSKAVLLSTESKYLPLYYTRSAT